MPKGAISTILFRAFRPLPLFFLLASVPLLYCVGRAFTIAFSYDECWTYLGYATQPIWDIMTNRFGSANNHILHSILMRLSYLCFGNSEIALRLPVLLSLPAAMWFSFRLLAHYQPGFWWVAFIVFFWNPYVLDYFSLARGYGLSLAFMLASLSALLLWKRTNRLVSAAAALALAWLAAYANFTFLLYYVALFPIMLVVGWKRHQKGLAVALIIYAAMALAWWTPLRWLMEHDELYFGGNRGFFTDTIGSLASALAMDVRPVARVYFLLMVLSLLAAAAMVLRDLRHSKEQTIAASTLLLLATGSALQHWVFGTPFLYERTALMLLPVLVLVLARASIHLDLFGEKWTLALLISALSMVHFFYHANFQHHRDFKEYADIPVAMALIKTEAGANPEPFVLGKSTYMNGPINYYAERLGMPFILQSGLEYCLETEHAPFYLLFDRDTNCLKGTAAVRIARFEMSGTNLYRMPQESAFEQ